MAEMTRKTALAHKVECYDVADVERPTGERLISMSNALTRAGYGLTLAEKRIVATAVSKLDSRRILKPSEVPVTKITAIEYAETFIPDRTRLRRQLGSCYRVASASSRRGRPLASGHGAIQARHTGEVALYFARCGLFLFWLGLGGPSAILAHSSAFSRTSTRVCSSSTSSVSPCLHRTFAADTSSSLPVSRVVTRCSDRHYSFTILVDKPVDKGRKGLGMRGIFANG